MASKEIFPMPWSKQPLDSCPCPPEAPDPGKSMVLVVPCFKVKCGQSQSLATDQLLFMAATVYCESPVSFQPRQYCLEIWNLAYNLHFFLHEEKKKPQQHGNVQLPRVNYSWMSPCSSNFCFLLCMLDLSAPCHSFLVRGLPLDSVLNNYP